MEIRPVVRGDTRIALTVEKTGVVPALIPGTILERAARA